MRSLNRAICTSGDPVSALPRLFPTITCRFTSVASAMLEWLLLVFSLSRFGYGIRIPQGGAVGAGRFFAAFRATPAGSRPLSLARVDAETANPRAPVDVGDFSVIIHGLPCLHADRLGGLKGRGARGLSFGELPHKAQNRLGCQVVSGSATVAREITS